MTHQAVYTLWMCYAFMESTCIYIIHLNLSCLAAALQSTTSFMLLFQVIVVPVEECQKLNFSTFHLYYQVAYIYICMLVFALMDFGISDCPAFLYNKNACVKNQKCMSAMQCLDLCADIVTTHAHQDWLQHSCNLFQANIFGM